MKLYTNTVSNLLWEALTQLMEVQELNSFRLVGGTSLSLQLGHRASVDIDMFTDADYGSIDFMKLENSLRGLFPYIDTSPAGFGGLGKSYFIGRHKRELVKLDLFYTDSFAFPCVKEKNIRFSSLEEVAAMKLDVIAHGGRKKDFWDIHELLEKFTFNELVCFYKKRYPYGFSKDELLLQMIDFSVADHDFEPNCFKDKKWVLIKLDFEDLIKRI